MNQLSTVVMISGDSMIVNAQGRQIEITCQGSVVMIQDLRTEDTLLLRSEKNLAIDGENVFSSKRVVQENGNLRS